MANEMTLDEYAAGVAEVVGDDLQLKAEQDQSYGFDPMTILTIISIIIEIVKWFKENYSQDDAEELAKKFGNLSIFQKWMLWRSVRREASTRKEAKYMYESLTNMASDMPLKDRRKLFTLKEKV